jgi:hypothetical protein
LFTSDAKPASCSDVVRVNVFCEALYQSVSAVPSQEVCDIAAIGKKKAKISDFLSILTPYKQIYKKITKE